MGTWSAHSFGNDAAADWVCELMETEDLSYLETTLRKVVDSDEEVIDSWEGAQAIAAAEVVAAAIGRPWAPDEADAPLASMDDDALAWAKRHPEARRHALLALGAVTIASGDRSELYDLWLEGEDPSPDHEWILAVADLRRRLGPA